MNGVSTETFRRLQLTLPDVPSIMLDTQYRMHPDISAFASKTFYNSDLKDGTVDAAGNIVPGFGIPESRFLRDIDDNPSSMMFLDHDHPESPEMKSIANHGDAAIICDIVADILFHNPVRLICTYGQRLTIRTCLDQTSVLSLRTRRRSEHYTRNSKSTHIPLPLWPTCWARSERSRCRI